jgi:C-terminal processing protease CtpA/Prc
MGLGDRRQRGRAAASVAVVLLCAACAKKEKVEAFPETFVGVGIELHIDDNTPNVVRVLNGGAADRAGLAAGDKLVAVNGEATSGKSLGDVVMALRGPPDSQVSVSVDRGGQRITFVLHRGAMSRESGDYGTEIRH